MERHERYLITGFSGFVSRHFLNFLENMGEKAEVAGLDVQAPDFEFGAYRYLSCSFHKVDLLEKSGLEQIIRDFKPDYILHLASYSSVAYSWNFPANSFVNNTNIFLNLLESVRSAGCSCRILSVGSSEEYGNVLETELPLREDQPLRPLSPYAVARVSQEMLSTVYSASYGMDIVMTRSFNHVGTGQKEVFVIPSFARQLIQLQKNADSEKTLMTGDTEIVRDFVDVKDVVRAYYLLFKKGKRGGIYNICSGKGVSLNEVISTMADLLKIAITLKRDSGLVRPNDNRIIIGDNRKIWEDTGWKPETDLRTSLGEILNSFSA
jgi:GDP-4-dehydro-6-deoxy-D-mannose reductase